jgi:hypothetical protein
MSRNVGIAVTIVTALCCVCLALIACGFGGVIASGTPFNTSINGIDTGQATVAKSWGYFLICLSIIFIIIPVVVGFFTLRNKPAAVESPVVPPT